MPEWFITLAPGLLVAIAPALLTLSVQAVWSVPRRRAAARADRSRIALDLIGRAHVITMLLPFTQAHAEAATKLPAQPLILLGMFPKFDLGAMGDTYSRHFAELLKSSSEARMSGNAELATLADELVAATTATFDAYINTDDTRPSIHRWYAARPPLDKDDAEQAAKRLYAATSDLERFAGASGAKFPAATSLSHRGQRTAQIAVQGSHDLRPRLRRCGRGRPQPSCAWPASKEDHCPPRARVGVDDPLGGLPRAPSARHHPAQIVRVTAQTRVARLWHTASEPVARETPTTTGDHARQQPPQGP